MNNILKIIKLSKPVHKWIIVACVVITIQAVLQQVTPIALKFVVDELTKQIESGSGNFNYLTGLFALILVINIILVVLNTLNQRLGDFIASRLGKYLTEKFYRKIFTLPQVYFDGEISGKVVNELNRGIISIRDFINSATNFIVPAILQAIFGVIVLAHFNLAIGLLALAVFPVYIAISTYSTKRWGKLQAEKNIHEDLSRGRISEVISNIKLVKTYNTQKTEWDFVSNEYKTINQIYDKQSNEYHLLNFVRSFALEFAFISIFYFIFRNTFLGVLSLGEMVLVIEILNQLRWPLYGMSYILEQVQRANADSKEFFEVLDLESKEKFQNKKVIKTLKNPDVTLSNIDFAYQDGGKVLNDINLHLKTGEKVAFVGHSGAGKTTLVNLILDLYEPTSGQIKIGNKDYKNTDHSWVREHMSLVFQDNELFSSTIRENVAYGAYDAHDKEIVNALKAANAYEFVMKLNGGLDAKIGERGVKLSGGQKQRIQIARAILHNKPILILDEATSSLDSRAENLVQDALEKLFKNKLVIIIAHRFSTIQNVDRIVVLDQGTIVDEGKPKELSRRKGLYQELLHYQIEGNKKLLSEYELH